MPAVAADGVTVETELPMRKVGQLEQVCEGERRWAKRKSGNGTECGDAAR